MGTFSDSNVSKKLADLNNSQQSIQTLSLWLIHHRKHSENIVEVWLRELKKTPPKRRLAFLYLANDVIQNSKKKGPEFNKSFRNVLVDGFKNAIKDVDEKAKGSMERIVKIWEERGVFDKDYVNSLKKVFIKAQQKSTDSGKSATPDNKDSPSQKPASKRKYDRDVQVQKPGSKSKTSKPEKEPSKKKKKDLSLLEEIEQEMQNEAANRDPPKADELVKAMSDLEHSASSDAVVRERIAALPAEVSDVSLLDKLKDKGDAARLTSKVDDACKLLADYNTRLQSELEERKRIARMLRDYITLQKEKQGQAESKLQEYREKLVQVSSVRKELKSHLQSLPDLTLLPDVTGLAPLPSTSDLFNADNEVEEMF